MVNQIMPGVQNPLLAIAAKIREQISQQAMTPPQTSPPTAGAPEERDYTEGMERPELTAIKSEKEFKATPSRTTAFLVALGNILQDKQNLEAAKQQQAQNEYNAKLSDAMELNKARSGMQMKREFSEADPDVLLDRQLKKSKEARESEMFPLQKKYEQAKIDKLFKKTSGSGRGGEMPTEEMPAGFQAILAANTSTFDPVTREPKPTPAELEFSWRKYLTTNPKPKDRIIADKYRSSLKGEMPTPEKEQRPEKVSTTEQNILAYQEIFGLNRIDAIRKMNEDISASRGKGNMKGAMSAINEMDGGTTEETPSPQAPPAKPQSAYAPGTILKVRGKLMKVINAQGDLQEVK